jgi:serine/threonine protein kinase
VKRITTKADIFSLGASLLEITLGINLPQNGIMWQKLRQAGEGSIEFSPKSKRENGEIEQLITLMMESNFENRPSADEILLHPNLHKFLNKLES